MSCRARINKNFMKGITDATAELQCKALVDLYRRSARKKKHKSSSSGSESIWDRIARFIRGKQTGNRVTIRCSHRASALKEYGGIIHAGGPFAEPSNFDGRMSVRIPIISDATVYGKQLGRDMKHLRFDAPSMIGPKLYNPNKLVCIPASHIYGSKYGKWLHESFSIGGRRGAFAKTYGELALTELTMAKKYEDKDLTPEGWGELHLPPAMPDQGSTPGTGRALAKLKNEFSGPRTTEEFFNQIYLVGTKSSRKDFKLLYILVPMYAIKPDKWMPNKRQTSGVISHTGARGKK